MRPRAKLLRGQLVLGRDLLLRVAAFQGCFLSATAVAARLGSAALAAHQIALQLWLFCALALDAVAIAAQALLGAALGAGDAAQARWLARRIALIGLASGVGFAAFIGVSSGVLSRLFTSDHEVHAQAMLVWPWFVLMQPLAGVVFALDAVLLGAGDMRYMRHLALVATLCGFLPAILLAWALHLGLGGIWAGCTSGGGPSSARSAEARPRRMWPACEA